MLLKSIKLENIRSYTSALIEFPKGSVLLAGDIGAGKSTILLAIEFALFGIKKGELSGSALLRNGKTKGSVELSFSIDNKDIVIKRELKRKERSVNQINGYIIINGKKEELTSKEMKARIISLLNYPKILTSKSKDLVYRYTIYTPQEEMKKIIVGDKEERLNTLRRVFNIDKYKRIKDNISFVLEKIRDKKILYESSINDLEEKQKQKKEKEHEIKDKETKLKKLMPKIKIIKENLEKEKENLKKIEKDIQEFNELKKNYELKEKELNIKLNDYKRNKNMLSEQEKEIEKLIKEIGKEEIQGIEEIKKEKTKKREELEFIKESLNKTQIKISNLMDKKKTSESIIIKIKKYDICPLCKQKVSEEHKRNVVKEENEKLKEINEELNLLNEEKKKAEREIKELEKEISKLEEDYEKLFDKKTKKRLLDEKLKNKEQLITIINEVKRAIGNINAQKLEIKKSFEKFKGIEEKNNSIKEKIDELNNEEKILREKKVELERDIENLSRIKKDLEKDIRTKLEINEKLKNLKQIKYWIEECFLKLMGIMEKNIMLKVYNEFNELFKRWFDMLLEDENINARLDEEFSPVIEQNGYETNIENLSGGEKTACALAYRLALNKVINDIISEVKTKDLIILDEPTDGFSNDQLDKIKDVIEQLNMKQIIIVSHEPKIESFVENIIRISKTEHTSKLSYA